MNKSTCTPHVCVGRTTIMGAARLERASSKISKETTILAVLISGRSLNRFEAEQYGDHYLNSTIARLRSNGHIFRDEWENLPSRFRKMTRVKRFVHCPIDEIAWRAGFPTTAKISSREDASSTKYDNLRKPTHHARARKSYTCQTCLPCASKMVRKRQ